MIFKIHYGLWYGGLVGIIPFMFNYATEYTGASGTQHGILYTILPFIALLAKPAICSFADKYAAHHHCLLFFITTTVLGYGSLALYPFFPDLIKNHKNVVWVLYCLAALVGNTSMCIVNSIGDSLAINSSQRNEVSYGHYRLWGPVGFGIFGAIWGIANEIPSMPKYTPGIITMVVILITNSLILAFWYDKDEFRVLKRVVSQSESSSLAPNYGTTNIEQRIEDSDIINGQVVNAPPQKVKRLALLWKLASKHSSIFVFLFLFTFCGVMTGIHWQFFFRYLENIAQKDKQSFSIIVALAIPVQALGGELVFFKLSGTIMKKLGSSVTLVLCLFSFSARYLLYAYLIPNVNIYWILLVELLQGPAFGLMYSVLTYQASYYSEKIDEMVAKSSNTVDAQLKNSLHTTLQGLLGASFEGLGLGLGAMIGGLSYDITPILMWQIAGLSALAVSIISLIVIIVSHVIRSSDLSDRVSGDDNNNELTGGISDEGDTLEELRRIARSCQAEKKPSMREIRTALEDLAQRIKREKSNKRDESQA